MSVYDTPEAVASLSIPDSELEQLLKASPLPPFNLNDMAVEELQAAMAHRERMLYEATSDCGTKEDIIYIPMRDGHRNEARVYKLSNQESHGPLVVLIFGGGFVIGTAMQLAPYSRPVAALFNATVVNISYRHAPGYKFPTAPNDVWDAVQWLSHNAESVGADPAQGFVIGGASAGGNLAVVTAQKALRHQFAHPVTGLWACIPVTLDDAIVPPQYKDLFFSREQNANVPGPMLNSEALRHVAENYVPDVRSVDFSPFNCTEGFARLPRTYVQVDGMDPLRDDGLLYERALRDAGVETRLDVYPGLPHAHWGTFPSLTQSKKANEDVIEGIGWLLKQRAAMEVIKEMMAYSELNLAET